MDKLINTLSSFVKEDDGSEVVEYALIIALVSIVLALALANGGIKNSFNLLVTRLNACFAVNATSC